MLANYSGLRLSLGPFLLAPRLRWAPFLLYAKCMATDPLENRSDENLHQMLDKGLAIRTLRRVKIILRRRERTRRQWLFEIAVAALIVAAIVWLLASNFSDQQLLPPLDR